MSDGETFISGPPGWGGVRWDVNVHCHCNRAVRFLALLHIRLTNSLLLTAKGLACIHPSVSFPLIRTDTTLKVCISVWEADMKILVTPPTADEYLLNMLCAYVELCFTKIRYFSPSPNAAGPTETLQISAIGTCAYTR